MMPRINLIRDVIVVATRVSGMAMRDTYTFTAALPEEWDSVDFELLTAAANKEGYLPTLNWDESRETFSARDGSEWKLRVYPNYHIEL